MKHHNVRERLIENTILAVANEGLDKTTTKAIVKGTDINEAYIYRFFADKEDLLAQTFDTLDNELEKTVLKGMEAMYNSEYDYETRCRMFFTYVWEFVTSNPERCITFRQYYYSPYFQKFSAEAHEERYKEVVKKFYDFFKEEADVWMIINHILNVILDFAIKVFNGALANEKSNVEHIFRVIFCSVNQYFKHNVELKPLEE